MHRIRPPTIPRLEVLHNGESRLLPPVSQRFIVTPAPLDPHELFTWHRNKPLAIGPNDIVVEGFPVFRLDLLWNRFQPWKAQYYDKFPWDKVEYWKSWGIVGLALFLVVYMTVFHLFGQDRQRE
eukprot:TRINITY_DN965_c0_g1_i1.p1 TRINITY_DN965_c0_g1~~TRINITY_DN965_c0_g1_i1.p1  ORF type:complete len:132 (-),score=30.74 TRINITY_DN965_c0_g1_i1:69-440(-)